MKRSNFRQIFRLQNLFMLASAAGIFALFYAGKSPENLENNGADADLPTAVLEDAAAPTNAVFPTPPPDFDITQLVTHALSFYNSLSASQKATLQLSYTPTLARKWSNLPCGSGCRNGIKLGSLTAGQLSLAQAVIQDVLGADADNGYKEYSDITLAEDALVQAGANSSQYNSGLRWLAFLNTPSLTGAWMLQFGGHHYAANIAFNNGHVIGATPLFVALEPTTFTLNGTTYAPMEDERNALRAMLASLSASELATAKLSTTFSDCLMVPGESNGNTNTFPTNKQGIAVSGLTSTQKSLVLAAIENYVQDMEASTAAAIMETYTSEINETYIAFTGNGTSGNATSFLASNSNYVRIDGPTVWIEFACQNGIVIPNQIHYHSVWRDHSHDYGVDLSGDAIDASTGVSNLAVSQEIKLFPNPGTDQIAVTLPQAVNNATVKIMDISGKTVYSATASGTTLTVDVHALAKGNYVITVQEKTRIYTGKFLHN